MGWLPNRLPAVVVWLDIDVPACRALAVAWLERGATEGKTPKEALRVLKRQVSDAIYQHLKAAARRAAAAAGPGGHPGNGSVASAAGSHPEHRLFGQGAPGPEPTLRPRPGPSKTTRQGSSRRTRRLVPEHTST